MNFAFPPLKVSIDPSWFDPPYCPPLAEDQRGFSARIPGFLHDERRSTYGKNRTVILTKGNVLLSLLRLQPSTSSVNRLSTNPSHSVPAVVVTFLAGAEFLLRARYMLDQSRGKS